MNQKVFILEDEPILANELKRMVQEFGYEVSDIAESYDEAIQSVQKNPPDLALCDIKLSGQKDGIETARAIQKMAAVPIIFITAYFEVQYVKQAFEMRAISYLNKPVNEEELRKAMQLAFSKDDQWVELQDQIQLTENQHLIITQGGLNHVFHADDIIHLDPLEEGYAIYTEEKTLVFNAEIPGDILQTLDAKFSSKSLRAKKRFLLEYGGQGHLIQLDDIYAILGAGAGCVILLKHKSILFTAMGLSKTLAKLVHPFLVQINRSTVINVAKVDYYERRDVYLNTSEIQYEQYLTIERQGTKNIRVHTRVSNHYTLSGDYKADFEKAFKVLDS